MHWGWDTLKRFLVRTNIWTGIQTFSDLVATTADINAGTVDATIGGTTPAAGSFTTLTVTESQSVKKTNVADAAYGTSALTTDYIVAWTSLSAARAAVISTEDEDSGSVTQPRVMIFKDESGNAETYPITISLESGGTINGASTYVLNTNYESVNIYLNGVNGFIY